MKSITPSLWLGFLSLLACLTPAVQAQSATELAAELPSCAVRMAIFVLENVSGLELTMFWRLVQLSCDLYRAVNLRHQPDGGVSVLQHTPSRRGVAVRFCQLHSQGSTGYVI
jgi:hypothetical protein